MFGLLFGHAGSINVGGGPEGHQNDHCRGGGGEGEARAGCPCAEHRGHPEQRRCRSVRGQPHVGMRGEDVHHDVEVGLADAARQCVELGIEDLQVEGAGPGAFVL